MYVRFASIISFVAMPSVDGC